MIDAPIPGSGELFDWSLLGEVPEGPRVILAGGLDPDNVATPCARSSPWGVDVSTRRREVDPGRKDPMKVQAFIERPALPRRSSTSGPIRCRTTGPTTRSRPDVADGGAIGHRTFRRVRWSLRTRDAGARRARSWRRRSARRGPTRRSAPSSTINSAQYAGRPSILTECANLSEQLGIRLLLKREDLNHTGSHKINNVLGQALLAKRMGKTRLVAETGAGQHGVATATAAALLGMECKVYMGAVDVDRQALNVFRMQLLGAEVESVQSGSRTLKDAVNEAMRDWVATVETTHYCLGSVMGPHPYPWMVREFHRVVGDEAQRAVPRSARAMFPTSSSPAWAADPTRSASSPASSTTATRLVGVEPAGGAAVGRGVARRGARHAQLSDAGRVRAGARGPVDLRRPRLPGCRSRARLPRVDRPRRVSVRSPTPKCIDAFQLLARAEGIIPALESRARARLDRPRGATSLQGQTVLMNLSGRGDKDVAQMMDILGR